MDSHSYKDVHDDNSSKNNMDSQSKNMCMKKIDKNNMDSHSYKDVHNKNQK